MIQRFAEKIQRMQQGIQEDAVGQSIPYMSGTRTGFNFKAQSYRERLLQSVTRYMPKEFASEFKNNNEDSQSEGGGSVTSGGQNQKQKPMTKAQKAALPLKLKIEKIQKAIADNISGRKINGV